MRCWEHEAATLWGTHTQAHDKGERKGFSVPKQSGTATWSFPSASTITSVLPYQSSFSSAEHRHNSVLVTIIKRPSEHQQP